MTKNKAQFVCASCSAVASSWSGRCHVCGEWNTLQEDIIVDSAGTVGSGQQLQVQPIDNMTDDSHKRLVTNIREVDIVFGGGIVQGSVVLIAGEPGMGKSTLMMQLANSVAEHSSVLYVSGEESGHQVGLRAKRLGSVHKSLTFATSDSADDIAATIANGDYKLVIVDSIQTVSCAAVGSAPGSITQITNSTHLLTSAAKQSGTAVMLVGHVTKEGAIAGPKILEHTVDVVLQLEGDRYGGFKVLRGVKNRYGSTNETGIFEMTDSGLRVVENPSAALLAERKVTDGSVVLATIEGTRPLLVEVQALVNRTSYGYPKRAASGIDLNRINLLIAVLERRTKLQLADKDIYINIVGGIRVTEPAADLAICLAIGSASKGMQLKENAVVFGEVGLSGEVRHVPFAEKRAQEAFKLGFESTIGPVHRPKRMQSNEAVHSVSDIRSALNLFLK